MTQAMAVTPNSQRHNENQVPVVLLHSTQQMCFRTSILNEVQSHTRASHIRGTEL